MFDAAVPLRELRYESELFDTLLQRNAAFISRRDRVAHLMCGSGVNLFPVSRFSCARCDLVEPEAGFLATARQSIIQPAVSDLICDAHDQYEAAQRRASKYAFRNEQPDRTSLKSAAYRFVFLELPHRARFDYGALAGEIRRVLMPGGRVVIAVHANLEIEDWDVNETLAPVLRDLQRRFRHPRDPLMRLGLTPISNRSPLHAFSSYSRPELLHYVLRMAGVARYVEGVGFGAVASLERLVARDWGRQKQRRRRVRCKVVLLEGHAP